MAGTQYSFGFGGDVTTGGTPNGFGFGLYGQALTDPSNNSFVYLYGLGWRVTEVRGLKTLPDIRAADSEKSYADGTYMGVDRTTSRTVEMSLVLTDAYNLSEAELANRMRALELVFQPSDTVKTMVFDMPGWNHTGYTDTGAGTGTRGVRVFGRTRRREVVMDIDGYGMQVPRAEVQIICHDPYIYGLTDHILTLSAPAASAGRGYDMTFPVSYGGGSATSQGIANNYGTWKAYPVVIFNGPCVNPYIVNLKTGEKFRVSLTIASGDYLVCDFRDQTVLLNGTASRRNLVTSANFWTIPPVTHGSNLFEYESTTVSFGFDSGVSPASASVSWKDTWI